MKKVFLFLFTGLLLGFQLDLLQAQNTTASKVPPKFYTEKIYAHLNCHFLISGESLLFKLYCLNAKTNQRSTISKVAYVELIDANRQPVFQTKIRLRQGTGAGDFFIPSTFSTGTYTLIAYTQWMKNTPQEYFYQDQIHVVNPFRGTKPTLMFRNDTQDSLGVQFFPEGGNFLDQHSNTIAFRVTNRQGQGIKFQGEVWDDQGNKLLDFAPLQFGLGRFDISPQTGKQYKAIIYVDGKRVHTQDLPERQHNTYGLQVKEIREKLQLNIFTDLPPEKVNPLKVKVLRRDSVYIKQDITLAGNTYTLDIDQHLLNTGISKIQLVRDNGEEICERLYCKLPLSVPELDFQFSKIPSTRQRIDLKVTTPDGKNAWKKGSFSVSIRKYTPKISHLRTSHIVSHIFLSSVLKGTIENPSAYFSDRMPNRTMAIDNVMLTHGWRQIRIANPPEFLPDFRGDLLTGTLIVPGTSTPIANQQVFLSIPQKDYVFQVGKSDAKGRFYFNLDVEGEQDLILQTESQYPDSSSIRLDQKFLSHYQGFSIHPLKLDESWAPLIKEKSIQVQVENAYYVRKKDSILSHTPSRFEKAADETFNLDDFTRFSTMEDLFRENINSVFMRKKNNEFSFNVKNTRTGLPFKEKAFVLWNGVPVFSHQALLTVDPAWVRRVETIHSPYFYKDVESPGGMLIISAREQVSAESTLFDDLFKKSYTGVQREKIYFSPRYDLEAAASTRIPDYRSQLYWNPKLKFTSDQPHDFTFYTSDQKGEFEIILEGITEEGLPIFWKETFEVH